MIPSSCVYCNVFSTAAVKAEIQEYYLPIYCVLCAHQYDGHLTHVLIMAHLVVVAVNCIEAHFISNAEYENHHIHPISELKQTVTHRGVIISPAISSLTNEPVHNTTGTKSSHRY